MVVSKWTVMQNLSNGHNNWLPASHCKSNRGSVLFDYQTSVW